MEASEPKQVNVGDMIRAFKNVVDNPLSRLILREATAYCEKDKASRLEVGLELYLDKRKKACFTCEFVSKVIGNIVRKGAISFGVSEEQMKERMRDPYWARGLISVLKGMVIFGVRRPFVPGAPFQVVWNITRACNMNCLHCYENAGKKAGDELKPEEVIRGLDILARAGVTLVAFSGGEPTIHPQILRFINHAHRSGMYVAMATNGYLLANRDLCRKFVEAGLGFVQISIDGLDPRTHDSFRRVDGAWKAAVEAVKNCVKEGLFVEVATIATKHNLKEIPKMMDFVRNLGAHWYMIYNFIPTGRGVEIVNTDLSPEERFELLKLAYIRTSGKGLQILSTAPQYGMVAQVLSGDENAMMIPTHFYNPQYSDPRIKQLADFIGGCGAGRFYIGIEPNGDIYPCVFFPHEEEVRLGNLLKDDFEKLWKTNKILLKLRDKDVLRGSCKHCSFRYTCGGCRARAYNYFHDILAPDPGCIYAEKEWIKVKTEIVKEGAKELPLGGIIPSLKKVDRER